MRSVGATRSLARCSTWLSCVMTRQSRPATRPCGFLEKARSRAGAVRFAKVFNFMRPSSRHCGPGPNGSASRCRGSSRNLFPIKDPMDRCVRVASLVLCVIAGAATDGRAQVDAPASIRSAAVTSITGPISIDGALSESAWTSAPKIGELIQRQPDTGQPPTERTDVTLLRDEDNLYIGIHAYDAEPDRVVGTQMIRDASLNADDRIEIVLDTFRDQRSAFYFATNPAGALVDGLAFANGQLNTEWDAIWHVRTQRTSNGWTAEFAIPFKSLSFPAGENVWGFNVARTISRKLEDDRWSGARLDTQFLQVSEAGEISNLAGLTQGIGLDLRPFLAGRWLNLSGPGNDDFSSKPGLDIFYSITPSLTPTATIKIGRAPWRGRVDT